MADVYAQDLTEVADTLHRNDALRRRVLDLIASEPIAGKVTEGGDRLARFRAILSDLTSGKLDMQGATRRTIAELPRETSPHSDSSRVFLSGWHERLVLTQFSRFYNQAVMETLLEAGETQCFVPHSDIEDASSPCSRQLAGANQDLRTLYNRLTRSYGDGVWSQEVKIPNHPHCSHVVTPPR